MKLFDKLKKLFTPAQQDTISPDITDEVIEASPEVPPELLTDSKSDEKPKTSQTFGFIPPNLEENIKNSFPNKYGLYPHEILVLCYAHRFFTSGNHYQSFWLYRYGIDDMDKLLNSLMERGFLEVGGLEHAVSNETISILKDELRSHGLKVSGRKAELVQRLLNEVPHDILRSRFQKKRYALTAAGQDAVNADDYVLYIHRNRYICLSIWAMNRIMHTEPVMPYRDKIWEFFNEKMLETFFSGEFDTYRLCLSIMSSFLQEENLYLEQLTFLFKSFYCDLSGLWSTFSLEHIYIFADSYFPYSKSRHKILPSSLICALKCKEELNLTDSEFGDLFLSAIEEMELPMHLFTKGECLRILFAEIQKDEQTLNDIYNHAAQRFQKMHPEIELGI